MWRHSWIGLAIAFAIGVAAPVEAASDAVSPESNRRKRLGGQLGIPTKKPSPPADEPGERGEPGEPETPDEDEDDERPSAPPGAEPSAPPVAPGETTETAENTEAPKVVFVGKIHRSLKSSCKSCHQAGAAAGGTKFLLTGDVANDYRVSRKLVQPGKPGSSALLAKAAGNAHGGGSLFPSGSAANRALRDWISDGAIRGGGGGGAAAPSAPPVAVVPVNPAPPAPVSGSAPAAKRRGSASTPTPEPTPTPTPTPTPEPTSSDLDPPLAADPVPPDAAKPFHPFAPEVHALLVAKCKSCHQAGAIGGGGRMSLSGDAATDHALVLALVDTGDPDKSVLLSKALGVEHAGGPVLPADSDGHRALREWIAAGAWGPASPTKTAPATPAGDVPLDATSGASPPPTGGERLGDGTPLGPQANRGKGPPLALPLSLRLHGKFDFSYEHRDWKDHPFQKGRPAFATYHHFLFLSRVADDPFGINVEVITQAFYEFSARIAPKGRNFDALFKAGKILVPFGNEPLFHRSYGGRSGFDQEIFPAIWAQPGISGSLHARAGPISVSNDLYVVQGYGLREADGVLNLQSDVSTVDDFHAAFGDRFGLSWGPLTGWYSLQVNRLGYDRLLMMQAVDLEFWRLHGVPVMEDIVIGVGGMRADVSGGEPGQDYYHFGSYASLGYYPIDFLYLQYRAGLRTTDNRRGVYYDSRRKDERDRSSHNISITGRWRGLYTTLQVFWNLEKANELDDDFMRMTVGYEF